MIESSKMLQLITQINTTSGVSILRADQMAKSLAILMRHTKRFCPMKSLPYQILLQALTTH